MDHPEILIANEPRAYREVIAGALVALRPQLGTVALEPEDLDAALMGGTPRLVVCSHLTPTVQAYAPSWILLYPDGTGFATTSLRGQEHLLSAPTFADLLAFLDGALDTVGN